MEKVFSTDKQGNGKRRYSKFKCVVCECEFTTLSVGKTKRDRYYSQFSECACPECGCENISKNIIIE